MPTFGGEGGPPAQSSALWLTVKLHERIACQLTYASPSLDVQRLPRFAASMCNEAANVDTTAGCLPLPAAFCSSSARTGSKPRMLQVGPLMNAAQRSQSARHITASYALQHAVISLRMKRVSFACCVAGRGYRRSCGADTENGAGSSTSNGSSSTATAAARAAGSRGGESSSFAGSIGPRCRKTTKRTQYRLRLSKMPPADPRRCCSALAMCLPGCGMRRH